MSAVLTINDARKRFGETQAIDGAALELHRGEWLALLGPNGAGKTSLVRAIGGRVRLDGGTITLLGAPLDGTAAATPAATSAATAARRKLGIVPQDVALYPLLTATENLRVFGALNGLSGADLAERVEWSIKWTGLVDRAHEPIKRFSGGMKRRLNLACGVLHRPEVILLDEPTVGVDPQSRQRIWEMLDEMRKEGASLLLTTHQLDEAQQVADRIVILDHGKAIAVGTFDELLRDTIGAQRRVTLILGAPPAATLSEQGFEIGSGHSVLRRVDDIAVELPRALAEIDASGATVIDIHIEAPSLQAVFIHLTGRELRE